MKMDAVRLFGKSEYDFPMSFGFVPDLVPYVHEDAMRRPGVIVVPGGGYNFVSPTEGETVALKFYEKGYNAFVFSYTTNPLMTMPLQRQPMKELSRAIRFLRAGAGDFHLDPDAVILCGFSAGAHLCGSVLVHPEDVPEENIPYRDYPARPDAAILAYPVITSGEYAHRGSFRALLGADIYEREDDEAKEMLRYFSLEEQVKEDTPPCFLWQTVTDESVPVQNSLLFAESLLNKKVPFALHLFSEGIHGLSTADEDWAEGRVGDEHCFRQTMYLAKAVKDGQVPMPEGGGTEFFRQFLEDGVRNFKRDLPSREVRIWPDLADTWLRKVLGSRTVS